MVTNEKVHGTMSVRRSGDSGTVLVENCGAVRTLTLNRPDARNALSGELISALYVRLQEADDDDDVSVVIVTGTDPAFCAGVDLKEASEEGMSYFARFETENCVTRVAQMRTPVLGAVNGPAFTGGMEIALGCDFLIASERAAFGDTHARVGILPGGGMTARLPRVVGAARARRLSMTGEVIDAKEALRLGLVTEVTLHEELLPRAREIARQIAEVPRSLMRGLKSMYVAGAAPSVDAALAVELSIASGLFAGTEELKAKQAAITERNRTQIASHGTA